MLTGIPHKAVLILGFLSLFTANFSMGRDEKGLSSTRDVFQTSYFIENKGQFNNYGSKEDPVRYALENGKDNMYFNSGGFVVHHFRMDESEARKETTGKDAGGRKRGQEEEEEENRKIIQADIRMQWLDANPHPVIYNRWGEMVFKTENPDERWNGNFKDALSHVDDYIYILSYRSHQKSYYKKGTVSLVR